MKRAQAEGHGCHSAPGLEPVRRFSWINTEVVLGCETLETAMDEWGYSVEVDDEGNVTSISFNGEKIGQEEQLFRAIAPIVDEGSYIAMEGEDYAKWRWFFTKGTCVEQEGKWCTNNTLGPTAAGPWGPAFPVEAIITNRNIGEPTCREMSRSRCACHGRKIL